MSAIEQSYPNSLTIEDMSRRFKAEKELVKELVMELVTGQLVKAVGGTDSIGGIDDNATAYRRVHRDEDEVTVVKNMPNMKSERSMQPTIAVITSQYHEKLAVDAVMTNKQTFVRYATVGKSPRSGSINRVFNLRFALIINFVFFFILHEFLCENFFVSFSFQVFC